MTVLAERLERAGNVVLRFDYTGTGDSAGDISDVPTVETWAADVETAIQLVRGTGVSTVGLVGLRVGALLCSLAMRHESVDAFAMWDPCITGRRFIREQRVLGAVVSGVTGDGVDESDDAVDIPSILLPRRLADSLEAVDLTSADVNYPPKVFGLMRPDRPASKGLEDRLAEVDVEWGEAPDQHAFFESHMPFMPTSTIDRLGEWCAHAFDELSIPPIEPAPVANAWSPTIVAGADAGLSVVERPLRIEPEGLFAMLVEPQHDEADVASTVGSPAVIFLNLGGDRRTGPSRLWVNLARQWASKGARVLRLDLSGLGDSPPKSAAPPYLVFPPAGITDVVAAAQFLAPDDPSKVLLVGVCSGAYHAVEAAMVLKSKAVWLLNPRSRSRAHFARWAKVGPKGLAAARFVVLIRLVGASPR
jgi:dienelactone hydrolase